MYLIESTSIGLCYLVFSAEELGSWRGVMIVNGLMGLGRSIWENTNKGQSTNMREREREREKGKVPREMHHQFIEFINQFVHDMSFDSFSFITSFIPKRITE